MKDSEKQIFDDIDNVGWHVIKIMGDSEGPPFCYSIGLYKTFRHPEIVIIGLELDFAHLLINDIGEFIRSGLRYKSNEFYPDILENFNCMMLKVSNENYKEYFGYGYWY